MRFHLLLQNCCLPQLRPHLLLIFRRCGQQRLRFGERNLLFDIFPLEICFRVNRQRNLIHAQRITKEKALCLPFRLPVEAKRNPQPKKGKPITLAFHSGILSCLLPEREGMAHRVTRLRDRNTARVLEGDRKIFVGNNTANQQIPF